MDRRHVVASVAAWFCSPSLAVPTAADSLSRPALKLSPARLASSLYLDVKAAGSLLIAVGERGLIVRSSDGGRHWTQAQVPVSVTLTSVAPTPGGAWWAVGHGGVVLQSEDGGQAWARRLHAPGLEALLNEEVLAAPVGTVQAGDVPHGVDKPLLAVHFYSDTHGLAVGAYGTALSTRDAGRTWRSDQLRIGNPRALHLYSIAGDGESICVVGERGLVCRSQDAGSSFQPDATPYEGTYFKVVTAGRRFCVLGMRGNAYWCDALGTAWHRSALQASASITGAVVEGGGGLTAVDEAGQVHVSADGGRSFAPPTAVAHSPLTAVVRAFDGALVVAGARGLMRVERRQP